MRKHTLVTDLILNLEVHYIIPHYAMYKYYINRNVRRTESVWRNLNIIRFNVFFFNWKVNFKTSDINNNAVVVVKIVTEISTTYYALGNSFGVQWLSVPIQEKVFSRIYLWMPCDRVLLILWQKNFTLHGFKCHI